MRVAGNKGAIAIDDRPVLVGIGVVHIVHGRDVGNIDAPFATKRGAKQIDVGIVHVDNLGGADVPTLLTRPLDRAPKIAVDMLVDLGRFLVGQPASAVVTAPSGRAFFVGASIFVGQFPVGVDAGRMQPVAAGIPWCAERGGIGIGAPADAVHGLKQNK